MSYPNALEVCRTELFTKVEDLQQKYPQAIVDKVVRVREMYNWFLSNPGGTDREFVSEVMQRHSVSKVTAYSDLAVVIRAAKNIKKNELIIKRLSTREWYPERDLNPHSCNSQGILSPSCLPIPPSGRPRLLCPAGKMCANGL